MKTLAAFNRALAEADVPVEMIKGRGYFYFVPIMSKDMRFEYPSEYLNSYSQGSEQFWNRVLDDIIKSYNQFKVLGNEHE